MNRDSALLIGRTKTVKDQPYKYFLISMDIGVRVSDKYNSIEELLDREFSNFNEQIIIYDNSYELILQKKD